MMSIFAFQGFPGILDSFPGIPGIPGFPDHIRGIVHRRAAIECTNTSFLAST